MGVNSLARLNQIIAIATGKKTSTLSAITQHYHNLQKPDLFSGLTRKYKHLNEEEKENLPSETKKIQKTVAGELAGVKTQLVDLLDIIATQEFANCEAKADIIVNGNRILEGVPVTYLLFLEKQLENIKNVLIKLPTLSADVNWKKSDTDQTLWLTDVVVTNRTKKVMKAFTKAPATDKHPAQVDTFTEDIIVGNWEKVDISSAVTVDERDALLKKVENLKDAVKMAREEANSSEVKNQSVGEAIVKYIFG